MIAFIGSVFSPYYAWARRRGGGDPTRHVSLNVALSGPPGRFFGGRWTMTERDSAALVRDTTTLALGPSSLRWDGKGLHVRIDERGAPLPRRVRGNVWLHPRAVEGTAYALDAGGRHRWSPIAPVARVEVALEQPSVHWSGEAYFDHNEGDAPLEEDFRRWDWSRATTRDGTAILYDIERKDGTSLSWGGRYSRLGGMTALEPPEPARLPPTLWRLPRATRAEGGEARVIRTLLDAPFYARSILRTRIGDEEVTAMHESLSLERFSLPIVQAMLPFRVPRPWW